MDKELFDRSIASLLFPSPLFNKIDGKRSSFFIVKQGGGEKEQTTFIRGVLMRVNGKIAHDAVERVLYQNGDLRFRFSARCPPQPKSTALATLYADQFVHPIFVITESQIYRRWFDCHNRENYRGPSAQAPAFIREFIGEPGG